MSTKLLDVDFLNRVWANGRNFKKANITSAGLIIESEMLAIRGSTTMLYIHLLLLSYYNMLSPFETHPLWKQIRSRWVESSDVGCLPARTSWLGLAHES